MEYAAYCERYGHMAIGVFATEAKAKRNSCDPARVARVSAGEHTRRVPTYFTEQDQSYPQLRAEIESQHPL